MGATVQVRGSWRNLFIGVILLWTYHLILDVSLDQIAQNIMTCCWWLINHDQLSLILKFWNMLLMIDKSWSIEFDPQVLNSNLLQLDQYSNFIFPSSSTLVLVTWQPSFLWHTLLNRKWRCPHVMHNELNIKTNSGRSRKTILPVVNHLLPRCLLNLIYDLLLYFLPCYFLGSLNAWRL